MDLLDVQLDGLVQLCTDGEVIGRYRKEEEENSWNLGVLGGYFVSGVVSGTVSQIRNLIWFLLANMSKNDLTFFYCKW